jgi:hypothetical protein
MSKENLKDLSLDELEALLEKRKKEEKEASRLARATYEAERDRLVTELISQAEKINQQMVAFKNEAVDKLEQFRETAKKYGDIRSNSKGGFSLRNTDQTLMVSYDRNTKSEYDERADLAEEQLRSFLEDKVKKRDRKAYRTIMALLTRNRKTGQFNPVGINSLLAIEDNYEDERWHKAMQLFKESYTNISISMSVSFYKKNDQDKDILIPLTFASL